jgi:hypothetical protein
VADAELAADVAGVDAGAEDTVAALDREEPDERRETGLSDPVLVRRPGSPKEARLSR